MNKKIIALARPEIVNMRAYSSARSEVSKADIYLDANENPFSGITDKNYQSYPEPQPTQLRILFSNLYDVQPDQLLITRGSDEGIDILIRTFCTANKDSILICPPTYGMYEVAANIQGAEVINVPLNARDFSLDKPNILKNVTSNVKLIFVCSPNNPTGNNLEIEEIISLCKETKNNSIVVVDEAYVEFSQQPSLVNYLNQFENLVILRTLSKAYGLAGIRCGITIAHPAIIQLLAKVLAPYPIPQPIVEFASSSLDPKNLVRIEKSIALLISEREKMREALVKFYFVKRVLKSNTNFLLVEVNDAKKIIKKCLEKGIVIRNRSNVMYLGEAVRITIGSPEQNKLLVEVLENVVE